MLCVISPLNQLLVYIFETPPYKYKAELQLNKANTSDKEISFLDLNINVICSNINTNVYDKLHNWILYLCLVWLGYS